MLPRLAILAGGFAAIFSLTSIRAAEPVATEALDWNEPAATLGKFVAELSAQRLEEAWQTYRLMAVDPPKPPQTPFDPDPFEEFQRRIGKFPPNLESLTLIGSRNYSAKSRRLFFVADTNIGPYLVEVLAYRYRNQWYFGHFGYHSLGHADPNVLRQYDDILPMWRLPEPVPVPLPPREPATETAGP
jgi:hypothetical protein